MDAGMRNRSYAGFENSNGHGTEHVVSYLKGGARWGYVFKLINAYE